MSFNLKDIPKESGIYQIVNTENNKRYIGSAVSLHNRCLNHVSSLKNNKHENDHLQKSFNKYGEIVFEFEILEFCNRSDLLNREQTHIDLYDFDKDLYNICKKAHSRIGVKCSKETREKISRASCGRKLSKSHRKKISIANSGINNGFYGKSHTKEAKTKISSSLKGERSPHYGKSPSLETRIKISRSKSKTILKVDLDSGTIVDSFCGSKNAAINVGVSKVAICNCCRGITKSSGGFGWEYKE